MTCWVQNSADDILKYFCWFSQKIGFDVSCTLSPKEKAYFLKRQFAWKVNAYFLKNIIYLCRLLNLPQRVVKVKIIVILNESPRRNFHIGYRKTNAWPKDHIFFLKCQLAALLCVKLWNSGDTKVQSAAALIWLIYTAFRSMFSYLHVYTHENNNDSDPANTKRGYNVAATPWRCSDVVTTLLRRCVFSEETFVSGVITLSKLSQLPSG